MSPTQVDQRRGRVDRHRVAQMQRRREFGAHHLGERTRLEAVALARCRRCPAVRRMASAMPWLSKNTRSRSRSASKISGSSAYRARLASTADSGRMAISPERSVRVISAAVTTRRPATDPSELPCSPTPLHAVARPVRRGSGSTPRRPRARDRPRRRTPTSRQGFGIRVAAAMRRPSPPGPSPSRRTRRRRRHR